MDGITNIVIFVLFGVICVSVLLPPLLVLWLYLLDTRQSQHAVLRNYPLLGRLRYLMEHIGPELRQYFFDSDNEGKPFSRDEYRTIVLSAKYMDTLISFGSKRNYSEPGWYLRNAIFPVLKEEMAVETKPLLKTRRYHIHREGLFWRDEEKQPVEVSPWTLPADYAPIIGEELAHPWQPRGLVGMSAMSYGALGSHAIRALSQGLAMAKGTWMNTGEGGLSDHHLAGGCDIVCQIGPGLFGVRTNDGQWDWEKFREKSTIPNVRGFELKFHQGAKIRGGHVSGEKVTEEIAQLRGVPVGQNIDAPNRFPFLHTTDDTMGWVAQMRREGGKPVGIKLVMGSRDTAEEVAIAIAQHPGCGPDWITVDGGEGGSGATYREMASSMGLPVFSAIVLLDDALRRNGVRDRVKIFASGKLSSADQIALALSLGADFVNIARGFMISVGCIQAQRCHTNRCPVGVATTDEDLMKALVVDEKKCRVMNYVITLRAGLTSLAAACGLESPTLFTREHAVFNDEFGRSFSASELFPYPEPEPSEPQAAVVSLRSS